jgi:disulfide oxidoreductase YuzD
MFCNLLVFIQSETCSGNTLSAMSVSYGSQINCIICSMGLAKDILHRLRKRLQGRNVNDQFVIRFILVTQYPGLQGFSEACD